MVVQADDLISFRQFAKKSGAGDGDDVSIPPTFILSQQNTDRLSLSLRLISLAQPVPQKAETISSRS